MEKLLLRMGRRQLSPRRDLRPVLDLLLLLTLELQLPTKLQICFCFPVEERMLREEGEDLEEDPFVVEAPFAREDGVD